MASFKVPSEGLFFYIDVKKKRKLLLKPISVKRRHRKRKEVHDKVEWLNKLDELGLLAAREGEPESVERC